MKTLLIPFIVAVFFLSFTANAQKKKNITVKVDKYKIAGTFLKATKDKSDPLVIIIPGSGPTDRNGNSGMLQANIYKLVANGLAKEGISTLRYDKLGVGESSTNIDEEKTVFKDNVSQVNAWISYFEKKKYKNIILMGHSEGSLIGILAAQENNISKLISVAGTGRSIDVVLKEQLTENTKENEELLSISLGFIDTLKSGQKITAEIPNELQGLFRPSVQPYLISWMKLDPKEEIEKVKQPILIVQGSTDLQVQEEDAEFLKEGNSDAKLVIFEGMNHIFKAAPSDYEENIKTYYDPKLPLFKGLVEELAKFILE